MLSYTVKRLAQTIFVLVGISLITFVLLQVVPGDPVVPVIWDKYHEIVRRWEPQAEKAGFEEVERSLFYQRAKNAYAVVTTGETAIYANILLRKGIITGENAL